MKISVTTCMIFILSMLIMSCNSPRSGNDDQQLSKEDYQRYLKTGQEIAEKTQKTLLQHVGQALKKSGAAYAITYCNIEALSLKDSLSEVYDAEISRISEKFRNPQDKPDAPDEEMILSYYAGAESQEMMHDTVITAKDGNINYYSPIFIKMEACLQCHGVPEKDIQPTTLVRLNELYPEDKATGFQMGDFRGAWKVSFKKGNVN